MATTVNPMNPMFNQAGALVETNHHIDTGVVRYARLMVPAGRTLFALIFLLSSFGHFSSAAIGYAASQGVPAPSLLVPFSGLMALVGGAMIALGYHTRIGALILIAFLVPVTLMMHDFWNVTDPMMREIQQGNFMKNLSMLGAAMIVGYFGAGPVSLDANEERKHEYSV